MTLHHGDCLEVMAGMEANSVDAIVTDPPYGLEFMGKEWDRLGDIGKSKNRGMGNGRFKGFMVPESYNADVNVKCRTCGRWKKDYPKRRCVCEVPDFPNVGAHQARLMQEWHQRWATEALRVAKPGAYLLAFGGTRTYHRLACAIEDAGWIIRDCLVWAYAQGFPKSRALLKPAWEPIVMARKPGPLRELAIDACRIPGQWSTWRRGDGSINPDQGFRDEYVGGESKGQFSAEEHPAGRWPANVILGDALFEPGVADVVIGGSLTGTMTAWSSSPDSGRNPTALPASTAVARSSRGVPGDSSRASATEPAGTQLDAWATSTDTNRTDTGCSDGTTADADATSGSTERSGRTPTDPSRGVTSSTTGTATDSITDSRTLSASAEPNTSPITSPSATGSTEWRDLASLSDDAANWKRNSLPAGRDGQPSADRRYPDEPGDFAPLPGARRPVDGLGYSRFFLIPKADRAEREPVFGGLAVTERRGESTWAGECNVCGSRMMLNGKPTCGHDDFRWTQGKARRNHHPTVKPLDLMRHLVRLVTPPAGTVLDPFLGSGTTAIAAEMEGFAWVGIEKEAEYVAIAEARLQGVQRGLGLSA